VHAADLRVRVVPVGTAPLTILAVNSLSVPPGTIDEIYTYKSEFVAVLTGEPAVGALSVRFTGAKLVAIKAYELTFRVTFCPATHVCA
jgi:hypothetical protein